MKNKAKFAGIIAIAAFIGFTLISCKGPSDVQTVATDKTLVSIAVTPPTKTQYNLNESSLDTAGMVVTATYSDNSTEEIPTEDTAITGFDSTTAGPKDITVSYGGQTANFTITVQGSVPSKTLVSIAVTTPPTKTQYNLNESPLSTAGMVVTATYSDNSTEAVTGYTTTGFSSSTIGSKTVTVTYNGKTTTFTVTVIDPNPTITPVTSWKGLTVPSATTARQYSSYQGKPDVLHVAPANTSNGYAYNVLSYSLAAYVGQEITITVSMQVWLDVSTKVAWQVNQSPSFPTIAGSTSTTLSARQWHTVEGTKTITPASGNILYLSKDQLVGNPASVGTPPGNVELYITGLTITIQVGNETILHTKWPFMVGAAAPGVAFTTTNGQYPLLRQFEMLVAENDMKPDAVMPTSKPANFNTSNNNLGSQYRWTNADRLVNYAESNNKAIRGHVLIWHSQTPAWFFTGNGTDGRATKAELYTNMETHIKTVFQKYGGRVGWWDVCNEVVADGANGVGSPRPADSSKYTAIMEDSGLTGIDRYEYVLKAFQWARQYADANGGQNVKLYLTDYNNEYSGTKQESFSLLVDYLITNDAPIDGVGFQTHIRFDWPSTATISSSIDKFAAKTKQNGTKLMTQVCELDMSLYNNSTDTTLSDSVLSTRLTAQATKYRELFDIYKTKYHEGKLDAVLIWGLADGESWLNGRPSGRVDHGLLFDRQYKPKAAYNRLVE